MGRGRRALRRRHRAHPADPPRRRAPDRRLPRPPVPGEHLLPLLLAPSPPDRPGGRAPHPRRLRRPDGVRGVARRRDGRRGPLRPLPAAVDGRGGVLRRRPAPGPGHRHRAAGVPRGGGPAGRHQRVHGHGAAVEPPDGAGVPQSRVRARQQFRGRRHRGDVRAPADPRGRGRGRGPGPARRGRGRPAAAGPPLGRGGGRRPRPAAASGTRCCGTCWPTSSSGPSTPSTGRRTTSPASGPTRPSTPSRGRSTWPWWSSRPPRCPTWSASAAARASGR